MFVFLWFFFFSCVKVKNAWVCMRPQLHFWRFNRARDVHIEANMSGVTEHMKLSSGPLIFCFKSGASFGSKWHNHPTYHPLVCTSNHLRAHKLGYETKLEDPLQWCIYCAVTSCEDEPTGPNWKLFKTGHLKWAASRHQLLSTNCSAHTGRMWEQREGAQSALCQVNPLI